MADSVEAEQALLGALLIDPEAWSAASPVVTARDFHLSEHQHVFAACESLAKVGEPIDPVLVNQRLDALGLLGDAVPRELVYSLARSLGVAANVAHYARAVAELHAQRTGGPVDELATISAGQLLAAEEHRLEDGVHRIPTGWERLDQALGGGFAIPSLNILGAAPKSGKSTWAQIIAVRHVEAGGAVYYLDLENGRRRFLRQLLCRKAELGGSAVAAALKNERVGVFTSREAVERWRAAKVWVGETLPLLFAEFSPPSDLVARLRAVRRRAGNRKLLVVVDSLQKLPGNLEDRRAVIDSWVRLFERQRLELDAAFLVISEIKRNGKGEYQASESAFKESGGIEYAADLALTMTRPRADEDEEALSALRVELARDCDEDPRGEVASYAAVFPHYGLEEREPAAPRSAKRPGPAAEKGAAARAFLERRLAAGAVAVGDLLSEGSAEGLSRTVLYAARVELGAVSCTVGLKSGWRLP